MALILVGVFVPESPLWLVQKGFYDLADNVIHFLGRNEDEFAIEVGIFPNKKIWGSFHLGKITRLKKLCEKLLKSDVKVLILLMILLTRLTRLTKG